MIPTTLPPAPTPITGRAMVIDGDTSEIRKRTLLGSALGGKRTSRQV